MFSFHNEPERIFLNKVRTMAQKQIHIWQFPESERILVKLSDSFMAEIGEAETKEMLTKRGYIKLIKIMKFCKTHEISFTKMEKSIIAYKASNSSRLISNPKLPLMIDPIFDMVLVHHFFDGSISKTNKASYKQVKDNELRENFKLKLEHVLGRIEGEVVKGEAVYAPRFLAKIFKQIYNIESFGYLENRIPEVIKNKNRLYKITVLTAAIADEGGIDSNEIVVYSANNQLLLDVYQLAKGLKYKCKLTSRRTRKNKYGLHIYSLSKFYNDFIELVDKYPFLTLGEKEKWIKFYVNKNKRLWWKRKPGETKRLIVNLLSNQSMKPKDLEFALNVDRSRVRRHLKHLKNWGIAKRNKNGAWSLATDDMGQALERIYNETHKQFIKQRMKGQVSKQRILDAVAKGYSFTPEIVNIVGLAETTVRDYLSILQKEGKVKKDGYKTIGQAVYAIWKIL